MLEITHVQKSTKFIDNNNIIFEPQEPNDPDSPDNFNDPDKPLSLTSINPILHGGGAGVMVLLQKH